MEGPAFGDDILELDEPFEGPALGDDISELEFERLLPAGDAREAASFRGLRLEKVGGCAEASAVLAGVFVGEIDVERSFAGDA